MEYGTYGLHQLGSRSTLCLPRWTTYQVCDAGGAVEKELLGRGFPSIGAENIGGELLPCGFSPWVKEACRAAMHNL